MRESKMPKAIEKRLLQVFLEVVDGEPAVHRVSLDLKEQTLYCTCAPTKNFSACRHTVIIEKAMAIGGGSYFMPEHKDHPMTEEILKDEEALQDYVVRYGRILIMPSKT